MGIRKRTSQVAVLIACLVAAAGCSEDDGFVEPPSPASLTIVGGNPQAGTTGLPLGQTLRVRVTDDDGEPLGGVEVSWAVTAGGGTLATATSTTDGDGVAVNSWTLGATEGQQTVTASVPGANTATFTATAGPRTPLLLQRTAGNTQVGLPGDPVLTPVKVRVLDANGLPLPGVTVTWTVVSGGGTATPATSLTNQLGEASTVWRFGGPGAQSLRASAPGIGNVVFTGTSDDCGTRAFSALLAGGRALDTSDCLLASGPRTGSFIEYFSLVTPITSGTYTMTSTAIDPYLVILRGNDTVAVNDNSGAATTSASLRAFLGAATYRFGATSALPAQTGAYTFTQGAVGDVSACETVYISRGASTGTNAQAVAATDCEIFDGYYSDQYTIYLKAGTAVTVNATTAFDGYITLFDPSGEDVVIQDGPGPGGTETFTYTPTVSGWFIIDVGTYDAGEVGTYTLTIGA